MKTIQVTDEMHEELKSLKVVKEEHYTNVIKRLTETYRSVQNMEKADYKVKIDQKIAELDAIVDSGNIGEQDTVNNMARIVHELKEIVEEYKTR